MKDRATQLLIKYKSGALVKQQEKNRDKDTHPKNVYIQFDSRSFTKEELTTTFSSDGFQSFLSQAEGLFQEVYCLTNVIVTIVITSTNITIMILINRFKSKET